MTIHEILSSYGAYIYAVVIFFGGNWGLKYFCPFKRTAHNFLAFASLWAVAFLLVEVAITETFQKENAVKYMVTYVVVTSVYELIGKYIFPKKQE